MRRAGGRDGEEEEAEENDGEPEASVLHGNGDTFLSWSGQP
jgi:hypothetical protein